MANRVYIVFENKTSIMLDIGIYNPFFKTGFKNVRDNTIY